MTIPDPILRYIYRYRQTVDHRTKLGYRIHTRKKKRDLNNRSGVKLVKTIKIGRNNIFIYQ